MEDQKSSELLGALLINTDDILESEGLKLDSSYGFAGGENGLRLDIKAEIRVNMK